jgi:hypothetical protein
MDIKVSTTFRLAAAIEAHLLNIQPLGWMYVEFIGAVQIHIGDFSNLASLHSLRVDCKPIIRDPCNHDSYDLVEKYLPPNLKCLKI